MKNILPIIGAFLLFSFLMSCNSNDPAPSGEDPITLDELILALTNNGNAKTWRIQSATLTNSSVTELPVSEAFNIKDDEFIFSANGSLPQLEFRGRNDFNADATDFQSFLLDYYKSPIDLSLAVDPNDPSKFSALNGMEFTLQENTIIGQWTIEQNSTLSFSLITKSSEDYLTPPSSLNFQEVVQIPTEYNFYENSSSVDILASQSNNSIYMIYSTDDFPNPIPNASQRAEGVVRYDLNTNQFNFNIFHNQDFFTKRAWISNNKLKVLGSQAINTYNDLSIPGDPDDSFYYNLYENGGFFYVRHDIVIVDDLIYIMGGSLDAEDNPDVPQDYFDEILTYNEVSQELNEVANLPDTKSMAAVEIVDGKIYLFGGSAEFAMYETAESVSYIYDIETNSISSFNLPQPLAITYAVAVENLIYVGGTIVTVTPDEFNDFDIYFGVYDTLTGQFTELPHNLDDSNLGSRLSGITYYNGTLYAIYQNGTDFVNEEYYLMAMDLQ